MTAATFRARPWRASVWLAAALTLGVPACKQEKHKPSVQVAPASSVEADRAGAALDAGPQTSAQQAQIPPPPDLTSPPPGANRTPSGLTTVVTDVGSGSLHPGEFDRVRFRLVTWSARGKTLAAGERSSDRISTIRFRWLSEALRLMVVGEKRRLWIPASLAAGAAAPTDGDLVADVTLKAVYRALPPPSGPRNALKVGSSSSRSGIAYTLFPSHAPDAQGADPLSVAIVNYTVWDSDGHVVDSTLFDPRPVRVPVWHLDRQWGEAVSLLKKGDKIRFSFQDTPADTTSTRMLVADLELLDAYRPH